MPPSTCPYPHRQGVRSRFSPRCGALCSVYRSRLPSLDLDVAAGHILLARPRIGDDLEKLLHHLIDILARGAGHDDRRLLYAALEIGELLRKFILRDSVDLVEGDNLRLFDEIAAIGF